MILEKTHQIYNGDCLDVMPTLKANSIDCILTDPPYGLSFMGKDWDKGVPGVAFWEAAYRVMKPGAFLLSFGGTRTFHRLTCAIEDAGFEIRDCMMWLYGSGFPKSHDVSKAIDKAAGAGREVVGIKTDPDGRNHLTGAKGVTENKTWGAGQSGFSESVEKRLITAPTTDAAKQWSGWGTALKPAWEPIIVARKPLEGTVVQNVQKWGCGAMNIDGSRIEIEPNPKNGVANPGMRSSHSGFGGGKRVDYSPIGRWPANVILDEEAGAMLDGQSGELKGPWGKESVGTKDNAIFGNAESSSIGKLYRDSGGASRFFYCAKASKKERGEDNNHPTVKPLSLLAYLLKLACPPNGIVLDPFMGSGSSLLAADHLGIKSVGIEKEQSYCDIAEKRVAA